MAITRAASAPVITGIEPVTDPFFGLDAPWEVWLAIWFVALVAFLALRNLARSRLAHRAPALVQRDARSHHPTLIDALEELDRPQSPPPPGSTREDRLLWATPANRKQDDAYMINLMKERARELGIHVDHIIPLAPCRGCGRRGLHVPENLQLLTPEENLAKGNRCQRCWAGEW